MPPTKGHRWLILAAAATTILLTAFALSWRSLRVGYYSYRLGQDERLLEEYLTLPDDSPQRTAVRAFAESPAGGRRVLLELAHDTLHEMHPRPHRGLLWVDGVAIHGIFHLDDSSLIRRTHQRPQPPNYRQALGELLPSLAERDWTLDSYEGLHFKIVRLDVQRIQKLLAPPTSRVEPPYLTETFPSSEAFGVIESGPARFVCLVSRYPFPDGE